MQLSFDGFCYGPFHCGISIGGCHIESVAGKLSFESMPPSRSYGRRTRRCAVMAAVRILKEVFGDVIILEQHVILGSLQARRSRRNVRSSLACRDDGARCTWLVTRHARVAFVVVHHARGALASISACGP